MGRKIEYRLEDNITQYEAHETNPEGSNAVLMDVVVVIRPRMSNKVRRREFDHKHIKKIVEEAEECELGQCVKNDRLRNYATKRKHLFGHFIFEMTKTQEKTEEKIEEEKEQIKEKMEDDILKQVAEEVLKEIGFGEFLKQSRKSLNMTQSRLSELSGVSAKKISALERELIEPSEEEYTAIKKVFVEYNEDEKEKENNED